jgi:hypothetical protein
MSVTIDGSAGGAAFSQGNILGTVTESSGVPTGAVVQTGSSADGSFTRWADGTQICEIQSMELVQISTSGCTATWTFPAAFSAATYSFSGSLRPLNDGDGPADIAANCAPNVGGLMSVTHGTRTASSTLVRVNRVTGTTDFTGGDKVYVSCIAIGRWY